MTLLRNLCLRKAAVRLVHLRSGTIVHVRIMYYTKRVKKTRHSNPVFLENFVGSPCVCRRVLIFTPRISRLRKVFCDQNFERRRFLLCYKSEQDEPVALDHSARPQCSTRTYAVGIRA